MNKLILKHFVLTDTNINDKKYYILCSTQQFTKDHYFVALYWAKATSDLHTGQEIDLINNAENEFTSFKDLSNICVPNFLKFLKTSVITNIDILLWF